MSLFCAALVTAFGWIALQRNGQPGFPLDDPWIHLQFARNLHDYGLFSYYKDQMPTSGATGPLYTFLLTAGFFLTRDEFLMSYVLGGAFFVLAVVYIYRIAQRLVSDGRLALLAAVLFLLEPRLHWVALSGMETTLFIFLLLFTFDSHLRGKGGRAGIGAALLAWTRPEAIVFVALLGADALYKQIFATRKERWGDVKPALPMLALFVVGASGFCLFNWLLSGSVLPNTYSAKVAAYANTGQGDFPLQVLRYFTGGHLMSVAPFFLIGVLSFFVKLVGRRPVPLLVPVFWSLALFFAYWSRIPYLYQEGRYLMPALPFFFLVATVGASEVAAFLSKTDLSFKRLLPVIGAIVAVATVGHSLFASWKEIETYAMHCDLINKKQVATAKWIIDNTPPNAVVATHDIGAIGYYSDRRIVDMAGLVTPEAIPAIGNLERTTDFLVSQKATHLAVLNTWYTVANQRPLFVAGEEGGELMQVFPFIGNNTHFTPDEVVGLVRHAQELFANGDPAGARQALETAVQMDPLSAQPHLFLAAILSKQGLNAEADAHNKAAYELIKKAER